MKNLAILWILLTTITILILFSLVSLISTNSYVNIFSEFEMILALIGFSATISTVLTCTKHLSTKISNLKDSKY